MGKVHIAAQQPKASNHKAKTPRNYSQRENKPIDLLVSEIKVVQAGDPKDAGRYVQVVPCSTGGVKLESWVGKFLNCRERGTNKVISGKVTEVEAASDQKNYLTLDSFATLSGFMSFREKNS